MAACEAPLLLSQADFARRRGVSRKAVTTWKSKGLLVVSDDGLIDVEQSEWNLDQRPQTYRGGVTHRPVRKVEGNNGSSGGNSKSGARRKAHEVEAKAPEHGDAGGEEDAGEGYDLDAADLPLAEAVRRKENFLGLQRRQDFVKSGGALVDRAAAVKLFFDTARDNRDAWTAWPSRISVTMANELGIDARVLTTVLTAHVQQHLAELGEPHADLG